MKLYKSNITGIVWKKIGTYTYECVGSGNTGTSIGYRFKAGRWDDLVTGRNFTIIVQFKDYYDANQ